MNDVSRPFDVCYITHWVEICSLWPQAWKHVYKSAFKLYRLNIRWAQMIFIISEIYFDAIRQDTVSRRLDIKAAIAKVYFATSRDSRCALLVIIQASSWFPIHTLWSKHNFSFIRSTCLTKISENAIAGCLRRWVNSRFCPIRPFHSFYTFDFIKPHYTLLYLQRCLRVLDYSASGRKSLQMRAHFD